jgi:Pentapeptide repeats (8 copies)
MIEIKHKETGAVLYRIDAPTLQEAALSGANLRGAQLSAAVLVGADLSYADLSEAVLTGANLVEADLCGTNFHGADLAGVDLAGVRCDGSTNWPVGFDTRCPSRQRCELESGTRKRWPRFTGGRTRRWKIGTRIPIGSDWDPRNFGSALRPEDHPS